MTAISSQLLCSAPRPGEWRRFREQRRGDGEQQQRREGVPGHGRRGHHYRELRRPSQLLRGAAAPPSLEKPSDFSGDRLGRLHDTTWPEKRTETRASFLLLLGSGTKVRDYDDKYCILSLRKMERLLQYVVSPTALALDRQDLSNPMQCPWGIIRIV